MERTRISREFGDGRESETTGSAPDIAGTHFFCSGLTVVAVRTLDELQDALDSTLSWRRVELSALKGLIEQYESRTQSLPAGRSLRRAGIAMLYAHWEGFTKECLQSYVDFLARRRPKLAELNDGLLQTALLHTLRRAESGDDAARQTIIEAIRRGGEVRSQLPKSHMANTQSNLRSAVLMRLLEDFGLDTTGFELREQLIDRRLCDIRNSIAHGRDACPAVGEFSDLHAEVIGMMEEIRDLVLTAARTGSYKTAAPASHA